MTCVKCGYDPSATIARTWSFFIDRRTPSMNDRLSNTGPRAWAYRKERDTWCWLFRAMRLEHQIPVARRRRRVTLTRRYTGREKERDRDNLIGGMKAVLDAMVGECLLLDDTGRGAEVHYEQRKVKLSGLFVELEEFASVTPGGRSHG